MVISDLVRKARQIIGDSSDTSALDARMIVKHVLGIDDTHIVVDKDKPVTEFDFQKVSELAQLRSKHMPMAYILGKREFMSLNFCVCPGVLIPRPDTECIVEEAIKHVSSGNILDIGTGSGAIAVSLAHYIPKSCVKAIDISSIALETAIKNAVLNNVDIEFINADIFTFDTEEKFDLIISNPPYIESYEIETLSDCVRCYEPSLALDGGNDGLEFYRYITDFSALHLNKNGYLIYEFGWKQHDAVQEIIEKSGLQFINTIYDLAGIKRGCIAKKI